MIRLSILFIPALVLMCGMLRAAQPIKSEPFFMLKSVRNLVLAVNNRDYDLYVNDFAEDVVLSQYVGGPKLMGREAIRQNRQMFFSAYPDISNYLTHLVAINNIVVMHNRVTLKLYGPTIDSVEIFTFEEGKIVKVEVIQPATLLFDN